MLEAAKIKGTMQLHQPCWKIHNPQKQFQIPNPLKSKPSIILQTCKKIRDFFKFPLNRPANCTIPIFSGIKQKSEVQEEEYYSTLVSSVNPSPLPPKSSIERTTVVEMLR